MPIVYHAKSGGFHLYNRSVSYLIQILENGQLGGPYFGKALRDREDFSHLVRTGSRAHAVFHRPDSKMSLQSTQQEYPSYGTGDFHDPAFVVQQENGSRISDFQYVSHRIYSGKTALPGLPATYVESEEEAASLEILLRDPVDGMRLYLTYTIFEELPVITRSARFENAGTQPVNLERAMSASVDLPDSGFEMLQLSGAWSRERHLKARRLEQGIQSISSLTGCSSAEHNPFLALKRPHADELQGEVYAFSLVYSGNFLAQAEVDTHDMTRVLLGIHPETFSWPLAPGESFQTPEAVLVYSDAGLGGMSRTFHTLYGRRLARGPWRDRERPILINNWEAMKFDFNEEKLLKLASDAQKLGVELFVLDDGWFGRRNNDHAGLGDWMENLEKLPHGISGLAERIEALGMKFGLWIEPEMVNMDSDLYRAHPDWILHTPQRGISLGRNQCVLDFSRPEVVDAIYEMLHSLIASAKISYIKWDMNRYLTECYSVAKSPEEQGKVFHQYVLGVYGLYDRLLKAFPDLLFESCASGGARFDPGMLYYAPQCWTSDGSDAVERLKIQYATSFVYPVSSMGAHVSAVPNQQVGRVTPLATRANIAMFGAFGYELDLDELTAEEKQEITEQVKFVKAHRRLLQFGSFYRLRSPFEGVENDGAWITVAPDASEAIALYCRVLDHANMGWDRLKLAGLDPQKRYCVNGDETRLYYGDELMQIGVALRREDLCVPKGDFSSALYWLKEAKTN